MARSLTAVTAAFVLLANFAAAKDVPEMPTPTEIGTTGYCHVAPHWEYSPRWSIPRSMGVHNAMSLEECAAKCAAHDMCTGATFLDYPSNKHKRNCWMKSWESPPADAGTPCYGGEKPKFVLNAIILKNADTCAEMNFLRSPETCESEVSDYEEGESAVLTPKTVGMLAADAKKIETKASDGSVKVSDMPVKASADHVMVPAVPAKAGDVMEIKTAANSYVGYKGFDSNTSKKDVPPALQVQDVGKGSAVVTETECAEKCDATKGCNAASYYGFMPKSDWPGKRNCWPKTIGTSCMLPSGATTDEPLALLLIKTSGETCPEGFGLASLESAGAEPTSPSDVKTDKTPTIATASLPYDTGAMKSPAATTGESKSPAATPDAKSAAVTTGELKSPAADQEITSSPPATVQPINGAPAGTATLAISIALASAAVLVV